jgi:DnaK suppressor protein
MRYLPSPTTSLEDPLNTAQARELVAAERARIEAALADLSESLAEDASAQQEQTGENADGGSTLQSEGVDSALAAALREQLAAVERAEARIADGSYGRSIESGKRIPDARLEVAPLAERTVEEQAAYEASLR